MNVKLSLWSCVSLSLLRLPPPPVRPCSRSPSSSPSCGRVSCSRGPTSGATSTLTAGQSHSSSSDTQTQPSHNQKLQLWNAFDAVHPYAEGIVFKYPTHQVVYGLLCGLLLVWGRKGRRGFYRKQRKWRHSKRFDSYTENIYQNNIFGAVFLTSRWWTTTTTVVTSVNLQKQKTWIPPSSFPSSAVCFWASRLQVSGCDHCCVLWSNQTDIKGEFHRF